MHIKGAIVFLLIILIGCGGGDGDSSSVTQPPAADTARCWLQTIWVCTA